MNPRSWRLTLRAIAVLSWVVSIVWLIIEPGYEPLLALLGGGATFLLSFAVKDAPVRGALPTSSTPSDEEGGTPQAGKQGATSLSRALLPREKTSGQAFGESAQVLDKVCRVYDETRALERELQSVDFINMSHLDVVGSIVEQVSDVDLHIKSALVRLPLRVGQAALQVKRDADKTKDTLIRILNNRTKGSHYDELRSQLCLLSISLGELCDTLFDGSDQVES